MALLIYINGKSTFILFSPHDLSAITRKNSSVRTLNVQNVLNVHWCWNSYFQKKECKFLHYAKNWHVLLTFAIRHSFPNMSNSAHKVPIKMETAPSTSFYFYSCISSKLQSTASSICTSEISILDWVNARSCFCYIL